MNRWRAYWIRLDKERADRWMARHARARARLWRRLLDHVPSEARLSRAERHMARLCALPLPWRRLDHRILSWALLPISLFPSSRYSRATRL